MINYINIHKKRLCGRNNNVVNPIAIEYDVVAQLDFQFIDSNNQIQTLPSDLSGMALAIGMKQSYPSYDLLALSKDYSISGNVISFNVNTYTQNWLNTIKKPNTEVFIEMSQKDLNNKKVWMRDTCLVWPRTYTEGLTPAEIDSNNYYTKTEVDEKIAGLDFAKKEYVDAQDAYLSGQIDLKASQTSLTAHTTDSTIHVTSTEKAAWTAKQNAITADNKLDYALISGHPEIPTKTSDLENDSDFQTSAQVTTAITTAISGKADKTYVDSQDSALQNAIDTKQNIINSSNKLDYALISGNPAIPTKTSDLENDSDFQTSTQVTTAISGKADTSTVTAHTSDTTIHVTSSDKTNWNGKISNPSGGTTGQILKKTSDGVEWGDDAVINPVNVSLETKDCTTAGTFVGNFTGKQIQRYNATNATSGTITIDVVAFTSTANDIAPTIECWLPANGDITTITIPSTIEVIDMPDKLEYSGETANDITYHVIVLRAAKDINGTWCYACNYAYSFLETIISE